MSSHAHPDSTPLYPVVVIGGGCAGLTAAIQSARAGVKTLLVEKSGQLGGTATSGGVNWPGLFHAYGKQVIAGIGWELVSRTAAEAGDKLPDFSVPYGTQHWLHQPIIDRYIYAALANEMALDAGVELLFHAMVAGVKDNGASKDILLCTKLGLETVRAAVLVDCSGDANAVSLAGYEVEVSDPCQPLTMRIVLSGYDPEKLDYPAIEAAFDEGVKQGKLKYTYTGTAKNNIKKFLTERGVNLNHIPGINARDSRGRTRAEIEGRKAVLAVYRFLKTQPGLKNVRLEFMASECGIRETVRIKGKATITKKDYFTGRLWEDSLCYAFYPIDPHDDKGDGYRAEPLKPGVVPTVPRGALLPAGSRNLIVAGRCLSSDRLANSALRVQGSCMAMGQAAGAMAALSAKSGKDPEELAVADIHALLKQHGAIVPSAQ